jgi:predicted Zn-dependent protease with MMP-like domain
MAVELTRARFEALVGDAVDALPERFARALSNVMVVAEDGDDPNLLGLYQGIPLTERRADYSAALPDKITIFRLSICARCRDEAEVVDEVRATVVHEIGHHFGIDDARLHELGW